MPPVQATALNDVQTTSHVARQKTKGAMKPDTGDTTLEDKGGTGWNICASDRSIATVNPIRAFVQELGVTPNPGKHLIKLSMGDPTVCGNLRVNAEYVEEYCGAIRSGKYNGYSHSMGLPEARQAVADRYSLPSIDDVVLTSGASGALEMAIGCIANAGDYILVPRPGFAVFETLAASFGVSVRYYDLIPEQHWEVDLRVLDKLCSVDKGRTRAIVVNNPCNPAGSVYSKKHLREILQVALKHRLPVIADEIYADMAFSENDFVSMASQSVHVPVMSVGGISKQCAVPGWRLGWLCIHDRHDVLKKGGVHLGAVRLSTRMTGPSSPVQAVLPTILRNVSRGDAALKAMKYTLEHNADFAVEYLRHKQVRGLQCTSRPRGGMFTMLKVDVQLLGIRDDIEFTKQLVSEEGVLVLPGSCFQAPNFVRICFCAPQHILRDAFDRMGTFCERQAASKKEMQ